MTAGSEHDPRVLQVQTTVEDPADGERIGRALVEAGLVACAQVVGPIRSIYRWHGTVESAEEWLCLLKTTEDRYPAVETALRAAHPYEEPEIIALPVEQGSAGYLGWVRSSVAADRADP